MYAIAHQAKLGKSDLMSEMREATNAINQASYFNTISFHIQAFPDGKDGHTYAIEIVASANGSPIMWPFNRQRESASPFCETHTEAKAATHPTSTIIHCELLFSQGWRVQASIRGHKGARLAGSGRAHTIALQG